MKAILDACKDLNLRSLQNGYFFFKYDRLLVVTVCIGGDQGRIFLIFISLAGDSSASV